MRVAALFLLPALGAVAGCGGGADTRASIGNSEMQAQASNQAPDPEKVMAERWQSVFAQPAQVVAAANEFGYKADAYASTGAAPGFGTQGKQQLLPAPAAPITIATDFTAAGSKADRIDSITFAFDRKVGTGPKRKKDVETARIPARIVTGFLGRFRVSPGDAVRNALTAGDSTEVELHGVKLKVAATPLPGSTGKDDRRMIVTITNSEALASS